MADSTDVNWVPEPFPETGGMEALGFIKLLGQPSLSSVELLVRETAQNSWDARIPGKQVQMTFKGFTAQKGSPLYSALVNGFFRDLPTKGTFDDLRRSLGQPSIPLVLIRDVNSHGLGGVTNAKVATPSTSSNRYRRFLLNVGESKHGVGAGGSYGYGRSICFRVSTCRTAVVYTRTKDDLAGFESRLVGVGFGPPFNLRGDSYNGKHWWNSSSQLGQPITGEEADTVAESLGMTAYGERESGTSVLIVDAECHFGLDDFMKAVARSIEKHLWPKYVGTSEKGNVESDIMRFAVEYEGSPVPVRDERALQTTQLRDYIKAFRRAHRRVRDRDFGDDRSALFPGRAIKRKLTGNFNLGYVYVAQGTAIPVADDVQDDDLPESKRIERSIAALTNHIVLLRTPDLAVTYRDISGIVDTSDNQTYCGVFKATPEGDALFQVAEPPSHEEWSEKCSDNESRLAVAQLNRQMRAFLQDRFPKRAVTVTTNEAPKSAPNATDVGRLIGSSIVGAVGDGPGAVVNGGGNPPPPPPPPPRGRGIALTNTELVRDPARGPGIRWNLEVGVGKVVDVHLKLTLAFGSTRNRELVSSAIGGRPAFVSITILKDHEEIEVIPVPWSETEPSTPSLVCCVDEDFTGVTTIRVQALIEPDTQVALDFEARAVPDSPKASAR